METFYVGQTVKYVPNHAKGPDDPICEIGRVSSVAETNEGTQKVWVVFNGATGQLTPVKNLVPA